MGSTHKSSKFLEMYIETQFPYYNTGSTLRGILYVKALNDFKFNNLYIRIQGEEKCEWYEGSSINRKRYANKNEFIKYDFVINKFDTEVLAKGSYAWPFSFKLSENLPGTFLAENFQDTYIRYKLKAYLVNYQAPQQNLLYEKEIVIRESFKQSVTTLEGMSITEPKIIRCIPNGKIRLGAKLSKNVAFIGEKIKLKLKMDASEYEGHVLCMKVSLIQNIYLTSKQNETRNFKTVIKSIEGKKCQKKQIEDEDIQFEFDENSLKYSSSMGKIVVNYYSFEISCVLRGGFFINVQPIINAPIFLINKNIKIAQQTKMDMGQSIYSHKLQTFQIPKYYFSNNDELSEIKNNETQIFLD